jgi:hypothetical protein
VAEVSELSMSFVHDTLVGHFDPASLLPGRPHQPVRPLDLSLLEALLSQYSAEIRNQVELRDGYVVVHWDALRGKKLRGEAVRFACRLAEQQQCIAAEGPLYWIAYPVWAREVQHRAASLPATARPAQTPRPNIKGDAPNSYNQN